jgi:predicted nucleic acid-binding protein
MNIVDTSGWLEYIADSANAVNYEKSILNINELIVPTIVLYEVFKKILNDYNEDKALIITAHMKLGKVIELDESLAINAAKISNEKRLPMADSIIYATAERFSATIYTQDEHFAKLNNVKYFKKK